MDGLRGFYRGMSASYAGISETVIHFVIYESIKRKLLESKSHASMDEEEESVKDASDFVGMMLAAATSKTCATSIAYPHGKPSVLIPLDHKGQPCVSSAINTALPPPASLWSWNKYFLRYSLS